MYSILLVLAIADDVALRHETIEGQSGLVVQAAKDLLETKGEHFLARLVLRISMPFNCHYYWRTAKYRTINLDQIQVSHPERQHDRRTICLQASRGNSGHASTAHCRALLPADIIKLVGHVLTSRRQSILASPHQPCQSSFPSPLLSVPHKK